VVELKAAQRAALDHVRSTARALGGEARDRIGAVLGRAGIATTAEQLIAGMARHSRVVLNFHPDRIVAGGRTVAEALLDEGIYRSQFESGISAGSRTAYAGGERDAWEQRLFGGAYHSDGATAADRPRYGGLNVMAHADGACPRFGSCHVRLDAHALERSTFCFGDSHLGPRDLGTIDAFEPVLAGLLERVEATGEALGRSGTTVASLAALLVDGATSAGANGRALDDYIEAQVHGAVELGRDADALVADPSFRDDETGDTLRAVADRFALELTWHPGFELPADEVPAEFRGPAIPPFARRVLQEHGNGAVVLDAAVIGRAARSLPADPETLQHLKQLWHVLVRYGQPKARREA
jgi:hypothetical protein